MVAPTGIRARRFGAALRADERVTPLELFFDLFFVLAITQCTALMSHHPGWSGLAQGLLVLGVLWWAWVGYAWLTSVVDPEEGSSRLVMFVAIAALLIVALCVPEAFGGLGLAFAVAYGVVRTAHIALFMLASPEDRMLRHAVVLLAASTAVGVGLLATASLFDGLAQGAVWALALALDMAGPLLIDPAGWRLVPGHFAERHGLFVMLALGESVIAIGVGAAEELTVGIGLAAILSVALAAAMWWVYFDVVAVVSARRLSRAEPGRVQNAMARDSYSYLHLAMIAGIVLVALGTKTVVGHHGEELEPFQAFALLGGLALYLLGLVAFRFRHIRSVNLQRLALAVALLAVFPLATQVPSLAVLAAVNVPVWMMIAFETRRYGEGRRRLRRETTVSG